MTAAEGILAEAAAAVILSFEGSCAVLPPHQRVSLQVLQLALEARIGGLASSGIVGEWAHPVEGDVEVPSDIADPVA